MAEEKQGTSKPEEKLDKQYDEMQKNGKNNVENIVAWLKNSKVIKAGIEAEERARSMFADCLDQTNIDKDRFTKVIEVIAEEQERNMEAIQHQLAEQAPKFVDTYTSADQAIKTEWKANREF